MTTVNDILRAMREIVALLDSDLRVATASPAFCRLAEVTPDACDGRSLFELGCGQWDQPALRDALCRLRDTGTPFDELELDLHRPSGGIATVRAYAHGLAPAEDGSRLLILVGEDITSRRRTRLLLEARLLLSQYAHDHSLDEVLQRTLDEIERVTGSQIGFFHFLDADESTLSLQSWSTNTLENACAADGKGMHYPVEQAGVWVDCVRQRRPVIHNDFASLSHRKGTPAGHVRVTRELLVPVLRGGRIVAIVGTGNKPTDYSTQDLEEVSLLANLAWDIVLHKRAEEALLHRERDLSKAQEVAHVGSWQLDLRHNRLRWSDEVYRIFGVEPQQFGATLEAFLERVHPDDREAVNRAFQQAVRDGTRYEIVHRVVRPDGQIRVVRERSEEIRDESGGAIRSVGTILDITELVEAQQGLRRLNAELEQRVEQRTAQLESSRAELERLNEQKNQLLGIAVHDLRNPLAAIQGFAAILTERFLGPLNPRQLDALRRVRSATKHMLGLVNDLLDVSTIEAGRLELHLAPEDLATVVQDAVATNQLLAAPKDISLALGARDPLPPVPLDRTRIEQVLNNLLHNAIKYSPAGSRVEVCVERRRNEALIQVVDSGRGVPPQDRERLFRLFGTSGRPGTGGEKATGLGLAIARRIVEAHGGRIWLDERRAPGSRFCVALPLAPRKEPAPVRAEALQ